MQQSQTIVHTPETRLEVFDRVRREVMRHIRPYDREVQQHYTEHGVNIISLGVQQNYTETQALVVVLMFNRGNYVIAVRPVVNNIPYTEIFYEFGEFYEIAACYLDWLTLETQKGQDFGEAARIMQLALDKVYMEHTGTSLVTGKTLPLPDNVRRLPIKSKQ